MVYRALLYATSSLVLKLTSTGHYGIQNALAACPLDGSEVDLNRSLWYMFDKVSKQPFYVLKLTSTGHYGITNMPLPFLVFLF